MKKYKQHQICHAWTTSISEYKSNAYWTNLLIIVHLHVVVEYPAKRVHIRLLSLALSDSANHGTDQLVQLCLLWHSEVLIQERVDALVLHASCLTDGRKGVGNLLTQGALNNNEKGVIETKAHLIPEMYLRNQMSFDFVTPPILYTTNLP
jgi:hypothetical protein